MPRFFVASALVGSALAVAACGGAPAATSPVVAMPSLTPSLPSAPSPPAASSSVATASASTHDETAPRQPAITTETLPPVVAVMVSPRKRSGKTAKVKWSQGLCDNTGTYDTGRFTERELTATIALFQLGYAPIVDAKTSRASLDAEFQARFGEARALAIVAEQAWENYRAALLTQFQQRYQLAVSELAFRSDPRRLQANPSFAKCERWATPLMANDEATLVAGWRALAKELLAKPGASRVWSEVEAASQRPGAAEKARNDLLSFGWHNCVNDQTVPLPFTEAEFDKLLIHVKRDCEH